MALSAASEHHKDTIMLQSSSMRSQKRSKPPPLVLRNTEAQHWPLLSPLAEFAAIATSPQSPLVKEMSCDNGSASNTLKLPSFKHVTPSSTADVGDLSSCSDTLSLGWSTTSLWERFDVTNLTYDGQSGKQSDSFSDSHNTSAQYPALHREGRQTTSFLFRPHNMKDIEPELSNIEDDPSFNHTPWSKYYSNENRLSLTCRELMLGDARGVPLSRDSMAQNENITSTKTQDTKAALLFDLDSAAQALSNMAKRKEEHVEYQKKLESTLQIVKRKGTRMKKRKNANSCARRPMNAFMLFAKRYRLEITRKHPGKDNRAISVILGDEWKSLSSEERKVYILEAKSLAEEHKRIYPDCWKRKRTTQASSRSNRKH